MSGFGGLYWALRRWILLLLIAVTRLNRKIVLDICVRQTTEHCGALHKIKRSAVVCNPLCWSELEHWQSELKDLTPEKQEHEVQPVPSLVPAASPSFVTRWLQLHPGHRVFLSAATAAGLPSPQHKGKALLVTATSYGMLHFWRHRRVLQ